MIVYTVTLFFQPHFLTPEMINGHFPVEDTLATAASVASVGLSLPSFAEDGPGMGKAQGMVYDRASEIHLAISCCICVFFLRCGADGAEGNVAGFLITAQPRRSRRK